jgi:hypothetical protein
VEYEFQRTRIIAPTFGVTQLSRPVEIILMTGAQCLSDPEIERLSVTVGPAAWECRHIIGNLIDGEAKPQTVAIAREQGSSTVLQIANIRINYEVLLKPGEPEWLYQLSKHWYVGLLARDDRFPGCILRDGKTHLSTMMVRSVVASVTKPGEPPPLTWAFCRRDNRPSLKAFTRNSYFPDLRAEDRPQYVLTRRAGHRLPPVPDESVLLPLRWRDERAVAA